MENFKIIFHLNELTSWSKTIKNIKNLSTYLIQNNFSNNFIELLINGEAIKLVTYNTKDLLELNKLGIKIAVCNNSLENFNISKDTLLEFIDIVPIGVLELAIKQSEGYSYIKA